jgi:hypothetical protein
VPQSFEKSYHRSYGFACQFWFAAANSSFSVTSLNNFVWNFISRWILKLAFGNRCQTYFFRDVFFNSSIIRDSLGLFYNNPIWEDMSISPSLVSDFLSTCSKLGASFISNYLFDIRAVELLLSRNPKIRSHIFYCGKYFVQFNWKFCFICCTMLRFAGFFSRGGVPRGFSSSVWKVLSSVILNVGRNWSKHRFEPLV